MTRFEHRAILESLGDIEALAPGLCETKISNPSGDPDCHKPQYCVVFKERRVDELAFDYPRRGFERVRQVSDFNETLYRTFISPWVQVAVAPWSATMFEWLHPLCTSRYLLSEKFAPGMHVIAALAEQARKNRQSVPDSNPLRAAERALGAQVGKANETARQSHDTAEEESFRRLYD